MSPWLIVLLYASVVAAAFWVANSENKKASSAEKTAGEALLAAQKASQQIEAASKTIGEGIANLQLKLTEGATASDASYKSMIDLMLKEDTDRRKIKEKLDWLEMKVNNLPKTQSPSPTPVPAKVVLTQEKPIQITIITRQGPPLRRKPPEPSQKTSLDPKAMDALKKKIQELSP